MTLEELLNRISVGTIDVYLNYWFEFRGRQVRKNNEIKSQIFELDDFALLKSCEVVEIKVTEHDDDYNSSACLEVLIKDEEM